VGGIHAVNARRHAHASRVRRGDATRAAGASSTIGSIQGMIGPSYELYEGTAMGGPSADYFFHKGGMLTHPLLCLPCSDQRMCGSLHLPRRLLQPPAEYL